jgi:hypothetical protein
LLGSLCCLGVVAAASFAASPAHACSFAPGCIAAASMEVAPADGAVMPSNSPALAVDTFAVQSESLQLFSVDAGVPATVFDPTSGLLRLEGPLVEGAQYKLQRTNSCADVDAGATAATSFFTVGPAKPLPTTTGTATVEYGMALIDGRYSHERHSMPVGLPGDVFAIVAHIHIVPSADLIPFLPVAAFSTLVDGKLWGSSFYGHGVSTYEAQSDIVTYYDFVTVYASCTHFAAGGLCGLPGVTLGSHTVDILAKVAGAADPAAIHLSIDLECPKDAGAQPGPASEGGGSDAPIEAGPASEGGGSDALIEAGPASEGGGSDTRSNDAGPYVAGSASCALARGKSQPGAATALLVVAWVFGRRRAVSSVKRTCRTNEGTEPM